MTGCVLLLALLLAPQSEDANAALAAPRPQAENDFGPHLAALLRAQSARGRAGLEEAARLHRADLSDAGWLEVQLVPLKPGAIDAQLLAALGVDVLSQKGGAIAARVDFDLLPLLKQAVPGIAALRLSPRAEPCASEGVGLIGADIAHVAGASGQGTRLAIIDVGFQSLSAMIAAGFLPEPWLKKNYTASGLEQTTAHGTAVAEIAYQMAPGAQLMLIKIANLAHFEKAMAFAAKKGADVVSTSIGFPTANFADGTGAAAAAVKQARKQGTLTVVAAGNYGDGHWLGPWADADEDDFLEFSPGDEGLTFAALAGEGVTVHLVWDDFPASAIDIDLAVYYLGTDAVPLPPGPSTLVDYSTTVQDGYQMPFETVSFQAAISGNFGAFVNRVKKKPAQAALFVSHAVKDGNNFPAGSVSAPADTSKAVAVGAVAKTLWAGGPVEAFSSRGPNTKGEPKPDVVGPDRTSSALAGYNPFWGTSAATPHVAGAACVIKSMHPGFSAAELESRLLGYALPIAGTPSDIGHGKVDLRSDFFPPAPDPPAIDAGASSAAATSLEIVAAPPSDATPPLQYRFDYLGKKGQGGSDADWSAAASHVDADLVPDRVYKYTVQARDAAVPANTTAWSAVFKIRTQAETPPAPLLVATGSTWVKLEIEPGDNPSSVEYALFNASAGAYVRPDGHAAGPAAFYASVEEWAPVKVKGLAPGTAYQFAARARNSAGAETGLSDPLDVTTQ